MSVVSSAEKTIGWVASTRPVPTAVAVVEQGDVTALGQPAAVVRELHPHLVLARRDGRSASVANSWMPSTL